MRDGRERKGKGEVKVCRTENPSNGAARVRLAKQETQKSETGITYALGPVKGGEREE